MPKHIGIVAVSDLSRQHASPSARSLGTRYLMEGPVYANKLAAHDTRAEIPELDDRVRIHQIILDELVYGRFEPSSKQLAQKRL